MEYNISIGKASELLLEELMKGFVETTQEADPCLIEPLHRDIGGRTCRRKHKIMWRSVTNAKDLPQIFINQEGSLILCPALGPLLNGVWILLDLSLRQLGIKYLLVGTDYFTKWVEAKPLANTRDVDAKRFVWDPTYTHLGQWTSVW